MSDRLSTRRIDAERLVRSFRRPRVDRSPDDLVVIERNALRHGQRVVGDLFSPRGRSEGPVIVTLHGSGGRREDLTQFAFALAKCGAFVCNASWRGPRTGHDLQTATADVRNAVRLTGRRWSRPVTLAAWSDAALPAGVVALGPTHDAPPTLKAFVGLAGYYGWAEPGVPDHVVNDATVAFFGGTPAQVPERWRAGNPHRLVGRPDAPPIALLVGNRDLLYSDARKFHEALRLAGRETSLEILDGCDHYELIIPRLASGAAAVCRLISHARANA